MFDHMIKRSSGSGWYGVLWSIWPTSVRYDVRYEISHVITSKYISLLSHASIKSSYHLNFKTSYISNISNFLHFSCIKNSTLYILFEILKSQRFQMKSWNLNISEISGRNLEISKSQRSQTDILKSRNLRDLNPKSHQLWIANNKLINIK